MNPIIISTGLFIILEGLHHFNPAFSYGLAVGMAIMAGLSLTGTITVEDKRETPDA